jgi:hypothetical protein
MMMVQYQEKSISRIASDFCRVTGFTSRSNGPVQNLIRLEISTSTKQTAVRFMLGLVVSS